jgi:hypothetical protein
VLSIGLAASDSQAAIIVVDTPVDEIDVNGRCSIREA